MLIAIIVIVIIAWVIFQFKKDSDINAKGKEADAVIARIEWPETKETVSKDKDKVDEFSTATYYVKYQPEGSNTTIEAKVGPGLLGVKVGDHVRIKYLPEKPDYVLPVTQKRK